MIFILVTLTSCSLKWLKITEDIIEGEVDTAKKVIKDLSDDVSQPQSLKIPLHRF
jgi:hypothetical protein